MAARLALVPLAAAALALAPLGGCDNLFELPDGGVEPDMFVDDVDLAGRWTITGTGDLVCNADPAMNIDGFRLETASFVVVQDEMGALTVPDPPSTNDSVFSFEDGDIEGLRVHFVTREVATGLTIRLVFDGRANGVGNVSGTFTGDGPRTCTSSGTFDVEITRR